VRLRLRLCLLVVIRVIVDCGIARPSRNSAPDIRQQVLRPIGCCHWVAVVGGSDPLPWTEGDLRDGVPECGIALVGVVFCCEGCADGESPYVGRHDLAGGGRLAVIGSIKQDPGLCGAIPGQILIVLVNLAWVCTEWRNQAGAHP